MKYIFILICSFSLQAQLSYNQKDSISKKIFDGFEKKYIEESFIIIWNDDTKAINQSRKKYPNPSDWERQLDYQRELEEVYRKNWYKKQEWYDKLNYDSETNESIAYYVRSNISSYALRNNLDKDPIIKKRLLK